MKLKRLAQACMAASPALLLAACGSGETANTKSAIDNGDTAATSSVIANPSSSAVSSSSIAAAKTGAFTLSITDGPMDDAEKVVVEFAGVKIKPANEEPIEIEFDEAIAIDLLELQGKESLDLLAEWEIAADDYEWVELTINAEQDGIMDSYIEQSDGTVIELDIPEGAKGNLRVEYQFDVEEGEDTEFTIDLDLRRSIPEQGDENGADFIPSMRMVEDKEAGHLMGEIDPEIIQDMCADGFDEDGAVYIYEGEEAELTDLKGDEGPIANALVHFDDGAYSYEVGYLPEGKYTIAYTCGASEDLPDTEDDLWFTVLDPADLEAEEDLITDFEWGADKFRHWHDGCDEAFPAKWQDKAEGEDNDDSAEDVEAAQTDADANADEQEITAESDSTESQSSDPEGTEQEIVEACEWHGEWHRYDEIEDEFVIELEKEFDEWERDEQQEHDDWKQECEEYTEDQGEFIVNVVCEPIDGEYDFPGNDFPGEGFPADELPADEFPNGEQPGDDFPSDDFPKDELPGNELPHEELPPLSDSCHDALQSDLSKEQVMEACQGDDFQPLPDDAEWPEFPADEQPTEEWPFEEMPSEEVPSEEYPHKDVPNDEEPVNESPEFPKNPGMPEGDDFPGNDWPEKEWPNNERPDIEQPIEEAPITEPNHGEDSVELGYEYTPGDYTPGEDVVPHDENDTEQWDYPEFTEEENVELEADPQEEHHTEEKPYEETAA